MNLKSVVPAFVLLLVVFLGFSSPAMAASETITTSGIELNPAIEQLGVKAGQNSTSFPIEVRNSTLKPTVIYVSTNDFTALNQTGEVRFYGNGYDPTLNPHGLASNIKPSINQFSLSPNQSRTIGVLVNDINGLAPGGHYGAVTFFVGYPPHSKNGRAQVSNNQVLSSLVFLTTAGNGTQSLQLSRPLLSSFYFSMPSSLSLVLANNGNTQTTPRGYVTIQNHNGKTELARGIINSESGLVLPASTRLFGVNLSSEKHSWFGGNYKFVIAYRPDNAAHFQYYQKSFYLVGATGIWIILVIIVLFIVFLVRRAKVRQKKPKQANNDNRTGG
jgi:hypothetical protein